MRYEEPKAEFLTLGDDIIRTSPGLDNEISDPGSDNGSFKDLL